MKAWSGFLFFLLIVAIASLLGIYWFTGFSEVSLSPKPESSNFSLGVSENSSLQFYENIRYSNSRISYRIADICTLQKKDDAKRAFQALEKATILDFYSVLDNEEILVTCQSRQKMKEELFVAGEGGPVDITKAGKFNVIHYGEILLIKQSACPNPNVAIHEILHALGFDHSNNENNIMYDTSKCSQTLGDDIPELINKLYLIPSNSDLVLDGVEPFVHGRYLDVNISIRNSGLKASEDTVINIYGGDKLLETIELQALDIGFGIKFTLQNLQIGKVNFDELRFVIESNFDELDKKNNEVVFELKK